MAFSLDKQGISVAEIHRNATPAFLYEAALKFEKGSAISSTGALVAYSGKKTGRSPTDKRVVDEPEVRDDIWWGSVNIKLDPQSFTINRERAIDYLNTREQFGVPLATFQATKMRVADAAIDTEAIRVTTWQAAWRLDNGLDAARAVPA